MKEDKQLSELQMVVMRVLWARGEATAAQVHELLQQDRPLAFTTVATLLSRLEKRGLVAHRTEGRKYVYQPAIAEKEVQRSMVTDMIKRLFRGDPAALVSHLLSEKEIDPEDLARVRTLIEAAEKKEEDDNAS